MNQGTSSGRRRRRAAFTGGIGWGRIGLALVLLACALSENARADQFTLGVKLTSSAPGANAVFAADLDGDLDLDVLSASFGDGTIAWYENVGGTYGPRQVITDQAIGAQSVWAADLDGDLDNDVITAVSGTDTVAWHENMDGLGSFGPAQTITTLAQDAWAVTAADLDGDLDIDVVSASIGDDKFAWYENTDGLGSFGPQQIITTQTNAPFAVVVADLDGDLDQDVISVSRLDDKVAWYENLDGLGMYGAQKIITTAADDAQSAFAADLDGDGDLDVISGSVADDKVAWYENTDGKGTFGPVQIISTVANKCRSVFAADLDGDLDLDVISASSDDDKVAWYENTDGEGAFGPEQIVTLGADEAQSVFAADVDLDGDTDLLAAAGSEIVYYEFQSLMVDWADLGGGTSGAFGQPTLRVVSGPLLPGAQVDIQLVKASPLARMLVVLSVDSNPVPAFGGTFFANPGVVEVFVLGTFGGMWELTSSWPPSVPPGTDLYLQVLVEDLFFPIPPVVKLSNAVTSTTP